MSGDEGGVWRTTDGGKTLGRRLPVAEKDLAFRDVEADSALLAQVLSIGPRGQSRIYKTIDGGKHWDLTFKNAEAAAFYDCLAMFPDGMHGLAMSDPVDGKFRVIATDDAGDTWKKVDPAGMPKAKDGEFGFAASGTCVVTAGIKDAWIVSGGTAARVFHSARLRPDLDRRSDARSRRTPTVAACSPGHAHQHLRHRRGRQLPRGGQRQADDRAYDGRRRDLEPRRQRRRLPLRRRLGPVLDHRHRGRPQRHRRHHRRRQDLDRHRPTGFHSVQCVGNLSTICWASGPDGHIGKLVGLPKGLRAPAGRAARLTRAERVETRDVDGGPQLSSGSTGRVEFQASSPGWRRRTSRHRPWVSSRKQSSGIDGDDVPAALLDLGLELAGPQPAYPA